MCKIALDWKATTKIGTGYNTARIYPTTNSVKYESVLSTFERDFFLKNRNLSTSDMVLYHKIFDKLALANGKESFLETWYNHL